MHKIKQVIWEEYLERPRLNYENFVRKVDIYLNGYFCNFEITQPTYLNKFRLRTFKVRLLF